MNSEVMKITWNDDGTWTVERDVPYAVLSYTFICWDDLGKWMRDYLWEILSTDEARFQLQI